MAKTTSNKGNELAFGKVHDFVRRWMEYVMMRVYQRDSGDLVKDWKFLESLSEETFAAFKARAVQNVISLSSYKQSKKQNPSPQNDRHIIHAINRLVKQYCIDSDLSLPGFYAFLRQITAIKEQYTSAFELASSLDEAVTRLVNGFWDAVRPTCCGKEYDNVAEMSQDAAALQAIQTFAEKTSWLKLANQANKELVYLPGLRKEQTYTPPTP